MGVIQPFAFSNTITSSTFMLEASKVSWITVLFSPGPLVLANRANKSALVFSSLGIYVISSFVKPLANYRACCRYLRSGVSFV